MYIQLKDFRRTQSLYQSQLAKILNTTQSVISRMELKGIAELPAPFYTILCEKYGKEEVDKFCTDKAPVVISGNINKGTGRQINEVSTDAASMSIIKAQSEALSEALKKQSEQTDRLLSILEKITDKQ